MNRHAYYYVALISVTAMVFLFGHDWSELWHLSSVDLFGLAALVGLSILSEAMAVDISVVGSRRALRSSMAFLPLLTSATIFPPQAAIVAAAATGALTELAVAKVRTVWKTCFNIAQSILSIGLAAWVYKLLGGSVFSQLDFNFLAFFGLAITFFLTNMVILTMFFAIRTGHGFVPVLREVIGPGGINILYGLLASPIAIFAAFLYDRLYIGGLLLIILPIFLIRYSYLSKIQLQQSNRDLLKVLIKTIETRDPYTSGHSLRVSRLARLIAQDLGLSQKHVETVETAALLHDIGKVESIYAEIIQKRAALTEEEHRVIKTHAVKGAELLQNLTSFSDDLIRGVRHHHERYDGKGYPEGLADKDIPTAARIIMLCDSIDAMLSDRPYRSAMTSEQVEHEIRRCAGSQFDPDIVEVVIRRNTLERAAAQMREDAAVAPELVGA